MSKNTFLVVANWKMNPLTLKEAERLVKNFEGGIERLNKRDFWEKINLIICPPAIYLGRLGRGKHYSLGIQNIYSETRGAFTGEIAVRMAEDAGARYALIGHSERRIHFGETDEQVNLKLHACVKSLMTPIVCVGENLEERNNGETTRVISRQIRSAFHRISILNLPKIVIAYEPVWAISTMKSGSSAEIDDPNDIMGIVILIKKVLSDIYQKDVADRVRIIYGGSVNPTNIASLLEVNTLSGVLVGGASLTVFDFLPILRKAYGREEE